MTSVVEFCERESWFDFHRCSNGPSKIEHHFRKQSCSKIEIFKKWQYQKTFFLTDILQWKKNQKDSNDFWHRKLTLKVRFRHSLTNHVNISWRSNQKNKIILLIFFSKIWPLLTHVLKTPPLRSRYSTITTIIFCLYSFCNREIQGSLISFILFFRRQTTSPRQLIHTPHHNIMKVCMILRLSLWTFW